MLTWIIASPTRPPLCLGCFDLGGGDMEIPRQKIEELYRKLCEALAQKGNRVAVLLMVSDLRKEVARWLGKDVTS